MLRSGLLAAWSSAWVAGTVGIDQAIDAISRGDAPHRVAGLFYDAAPLQDGLLGLRRAGEPVRLLLPVPGDVRGVPGPAAFRDAALEAGEAVHGAGVGLVPEVTDYFPSSAPSTVVWQAFAVEPAPADPIDVADAQYELTTAIRETASALLAADVAGGVAESTAGLPAARRASENLDLPPGFPPRALAMLAQAERMHAVLELALADPAGGAIDRMGMAARTSALRPLVTAVRRARLAGYNALARS